MTPCYSKGVEALSGLHRTCENSNMQSYLPPGYLPVADDRPWPNSSGKIPANGQMRCFDLCDVVGYSQGLLLDFSLHLCGRRPPTMMPYFNVLDFSVNALD